MQYCLFDLDGTLYSRKTGLIDRLIGRTKVYMVERIGLDENDTDATFEDYHGRFGSVLGGLIEEHEVDREEYLSFVFGVPVEEHLADNPDLRAMLESIEAQKCVFSNSPRWHIENVLGCLGIRACFERLFDTEAVNYASKPDPGPYRTVLALLGAPANECLFIDDKPPNVLTAQELGMIPVLLDENGRYKGDKLDFVISEITELPNVIRRVQASS